tara:strand:- start:253 stop:528 length:276 start_codon:yes stop_codon:yes gene_type:complete
MKKYDKQVYVAWCIEDGVRFYTLFMTNEEDPVKIHRFGMDEAEQWGAQCWDVLLLEDCPEIEPPTDYVWDMDISSEENFKRDPNIKDEEND